MAWTDERLDDLAGRMDAGFARTASDTRELRTELRNEIGGLRTELRGEIGSLRTELKGDIGGLRTELKGDIEGLRSVMLRFGVAIMVCLIGVIATLIGAMASGSIAG